MMSGGSGHLTPPSPAGSAGPRHPGLTRATQKIGQARACPFLPAYSDLFLLRSVGNQFQQLLITVPAPLLQSFQTLPPQDTEFTSLLWGHDSQAWLADSDEGVALRDFRYRGSHPRRTCRTIWSFAFDQTYCSARVHDAAIG